jgi:segregation and condensation protein B
MSEMDDARAADPVASGFDTYDGPVGFRLDESGAPTVIPFSCEEGEIRDDLVREEDHGPSLRRILEAILFATDRPVTIEQLLIALPERTDDEIVRELEEMTADYDALGTGFRLLPCAGGWQIRTDPEMHEFVTRFLVGKKRTRLSRAAMETLAIIAYRQPITRGEVEEVRGVDSGQVFHTLLERNLVTVKGRSQSLGRPLLYGTTDDFLRYFGLNTLADLPSPEELEALIGDDPLDDPEIKQALEVNGFGPVAAEEGAGPVAAEGAGDVAGETPEASTGEAVGSEFPDDLDDDFDEAPDAPPHGNGSEPAPGPCA